MKNTRERIGKILSYVFGIGIFIALFIGGLSFIGYIVALIIGGDIASQICFIIYKKIYPILFMFSASIVLLGLIKMYTVGEKSMVPTKIKKQDKPKELKTTTGNDLHDGSNNV